MTRPRYAAFVIMGRTVVHRLDHIADVGFGRHGGFYRRAYIAACGVEADSANIVRRAGRATCKHCKRAHAGSA